MASRPRKSFQPNFMVTAARQTEELLREELNELGLAQTHVVPGAVQVKGTLEDAMRVCLWSRIGMRVHWKIGEDTVRSDRQIYPSVRSLPLGDWFDADHSIAVFAQSRGGVFRDPAWIALKAKDAIVDDVRKRSKRRPNVDKGRPDVSLAIHIDGEQATYWIELQGAPLSQRGYRVAEGIAPLKQTLAAAMLRYAKWDGRRPLMDPTCGSGTIPIEAAMIATKTAPGLFRDFGFMRWPKWESLKPTWNAMVDEAKRARLPRSRSVIIGADHHEPTIRKCRQNAGQVGLLHDIEWRVADARKIEDVPDDTLFVMNPPYGERIGDHDKLDALYEKIWDRLGYYSEASVCMITTEKYAGAFGVDPARSFNVLNGRLPCEIGFFPTTHD